LHWHSGGGVTAAFFHNSPWIVNFISIGDCLLRVSRQQAICPPVKDTVGQARSRLADLRVSSPNWRPSASSVSSLTHCGIVLARCAQLLVTTLLHFVCHSTNLPSTSASVFFRACSTSAIRDFSRIRLSAIGLPFLDAASQWTAPQPAARHRISAAFSICRPQMAGICCSRSTTRPSLPSRFAWQLLRGVFSRGWSSKRRRSRSFRCEWHFKTSDGRPCRAFAKLYPSSWQKLRIACSRSLLGPTRLQSEVLGSVVTIFRCIEVQFEESSRAVLPSCRASVPLLFLLSGMISSLLLLAPLV